MGGLVLLRCVLDMSSVVLCVAQCNNGLFVILLEQRGLHRHTHPSSAPRPSIVPQPKSEHLLPASYDISLPTTAAYTHHPPPVLRQPLLVGRRHLPHDVGYWTLPQLEPDIACEHHRAEQERVRGRVWTVGWGRATFRYGR